MKIELNIENLTETISALNNAINTYNDLRGQIFLHIDIPLKYEGLKSDNIDCPEEKIDKRLKLLDSIYNQLIEIEKGEQTK